MAIYDLFVLNAPDDQTTRGMSISIVRGKALLTLNTAFPRKFDVPVSSSYQPPRYQRTVCSCHPDFTIVTQTWLSKKNEYQAMILGLVPNSTLHARLRRSRLQDKLVELKQEYVEELRDMEKAVLSAWAEP